MKTKIATLAAVIAAAAMPLGAAQNTNNATFSQNGTTLGIQKWPLGLYFGTSAANFGAVSSLQDKGRIFLMGVNFSCQDAAGKYESDSNTPAAKTKVLEKSFKAGYAVWKVQYDWEYITMTRTVEVANDLPGVKFTYDYEVRKDFKSKRLYASFRPPKHDYNLTGYMKGSVMQFRPAVKDEWFGILRSRKFPFITFSGDGKGGVMIAAANKASWDQLPGMLLYASNKKAYWTAEFMYQQNKELKKGEKGSYSFHIVPLNGKDTAADVAAIYETLKDTIK